MNIYEPTTDIKRLPSSSGPWRFRGPRWPHGSGKVFQCSRCSGSSVVAAEAGWTPASWPFSSAPSVRPGGGFLLNHAAAIASWGTFFPESSGSFLYVLSACLGRNQQTIRWILHRSLSKWDKIMSKSPIKIEFLQASTFFGGNDNATTKNHQGIRPLGASKGGPERVRSTPSRRAAASPGPSSSPHGENGTRSPSHLRDVGRSKGAWGGWNRQDDDLLGRSGGLVRGWLWFMIFCVP